jgi:hypothetical protein
MGIDPRIERARRVLLARIASYGYTHLSAVGGVIYTYTVGLPAYARHPELVVCGIPPDEAIPISGDVIRLLSDSRALDGRVMGLLEDDMPLWVAPIPEATVASQLSAASWWRKEHHDGKPATAKQIILPDAARRFPWQAGCDPDLRALQSLLLPEIAVREPDVVTSQPRDAAGCPRNLRREASVRRRRPRR